MLGGPVDRRVGLDQPVHNGVLEQLDRGGNPTINPFINPDGEKNLFNSRQPADDVANYLEPWSAILQNAGGYTPEQARAAALQVLPDILHYDRTKPATYPNGRVLTDDVYSHAFRLADQRQGPRRPASSPTTTCSPTSPTSARPTPSRRPSPRRYAAGTVPGDHPRRPAHREGQPELRRLNFLFGPQPSRRRPDHGIPRHHDHPRPGRNPGRSRPGHPHPRGRPLRELAAQGTCCACGARRCNQANGARSGCSPPPTATGSRKSSPRCRCGYGAPMRSPRSHRTRTTLPRRPEQGRRRRSSW